MVYLLTFMPGVLLNKSFLMPILSGVKLLYDKHFPGFSRGFLKNRIKKHLPFVAGHRRVRGMGKAQRFSSTGSERSCPVPCGPGAV
jgi:hypothetical protein